MKIKSILPFLPFFTLFLLVGFWTGHRIAASAQQSLPQDQESAQLPIVEVDSLPPTPTLPALSQPATLAPLPSPTLPLQTSSQGSAQPAQLASRQRNLLIIGIDDLGASNPRLEAVWLVIYIPANPHFMLLPVYPSPAASPDSSSPNPPLAQLFELHETKAPGVKFLQALEENGLWWTGYLILDTVALADVIEFLGGAGEISTLDGANTIASIPHAAEDPQQALTSQAWLLQGLCSSMDRLTLDDHWRLPHLFDLIPTHAVTNLDLNQVSAEWQGLLQHAGEITCEYPSLSQTSFHP